MSYERRYQPIGRSVGNATLSEIGDVTITSAADNDILQYNSGTGKWENVAGELSSLSDVTITSAAEGETLIYSSGVWVNNSDFNLNIGALADGDVLQYNSGNGRWTNVTVASLVLTAVDDQAYPAHLGHAGI